MRSRIRPIASARRRRQEEVRWFSREGDWSVGLLFAVVVGGLIFLGFVQFVKKPGFKMGADGPDCEDAKKKWQ